MNNQRVHKGGFKTGGPWARGQTKNKIALSFDRVRFESCFVGFCLRSPVVQCDIREMFHGEFGATCKQVFWFEVTVDC